MSGALPEHASCPITALAEIAALCRGATCYLNSLLQAMYMTPELRGALYQVNPSRLGVSRVSCVQLFRCLCVPSVWTCRGLRLHFSHFSAYEPRFPLQLDEYCKALEASKTGTAEEAAAATAALRAKGKPMVAALELQRLFARLQRLDQRSVATEALTRYGFEWFSSEGGVQHDVQELNRLLYDKIEKQLKNTPGRNIIPSLYKFPIAYRKTFLAPQLGVTEATQQPGYDLSVIVQGNPDLAHALAASITPEYFSGLEAPNGERCAAVRGVELQELPPVLVISLNRSGFNPATFDPIKVEDRCAFPLALDMRPFVAGGEVARATKADVLRSNGVAVGPDGAPIPEGSDPPQSSPPSVAAAIQRASDRSVWLHDDLTSDAVAARSLKAPSPPPRG